MSTYEDIVDDAICKLMEQGYDAKVVYCISQKGELLEIRIEILGRLA